MESTNTMPALQEAILTWLRQWKGETDANPQWTTRYGLREAIRCQDKLG
jgi:hypothetical protein